MLIYLQDMIGIHTNTILLIAFTLFSVGHLNKTRAQSKINFQSSFSQTKNDDHVAEWDFYLSNVDEKLS